MKNTHKTIGKMVKMLSPYDLIQSCVNCRVQVLVESQIKNPIWSLSYWRVYIIVEDHVWNTRWYSNNR